MPTAEGSFVYDTTMKGANPDPGERKFIAHFTINNVNYSFEGDFHAEIPPFRCTTASLRYGDTKDWSLQQGKFLGRIGKETLTLNFSHEAKMSITCIMDHPVHKAFSVPAGTGQWFTNDADKVPTLRTVPSK